MKIFRKWFLKHWVQAQRDYHNTSMEAASCELTVAGSYSNSISSKASNSNVETQGIHFTLYKANGGNVLEYRFFNESTGRSEGSMHLIPAGEDMGKVIEHAITAEMLKR